MENLLGRDGEICQEGLPPTESKVSDVADAPEPKSGRIEIIPGASELLWEVLGQPSHHCSTPVQPGEENARWTLDMSQKAAFKG